MDIKFTTQYNAKYRLLSYYKQEQVKDTLDLFRENPHDHSLRNHALKKPMQGKYSISVDNNLRIIFQERGGYIEVLMLDVGNHDEVYL